MSEQKKKQKKLIFTTIAILAIVIIGFSYISSNANWVWAYPTPTPSTTPTINPSSTPTPTLPVPTSTPTWNPVPSSTPSQGNSPVANMWQSLYITNTDGTKYWIEPPAPIKAESVLGYDGHLWHIISTVQNNIYINVDLKGLSVGSWTASCLETITIQDINHNTIGTVASQQVSGSGVNYWTPLTSGTTTWVLGSTINSNSVQSIVAAYNNSPYYKCYFVVTISNVSINFNFNDGTSGTLTNSHDVTSLAWEIQINS